MNKEKLHILNHPLLQHKLGFLRDKNTLSGDFRDLMKEISALLAYEALRDWEYMKAVSIETPIAKARVERISDPPVVVAILRAGMGMLDSVLSVLPFASAGFIGIYRDKFINNTVEYYFKMPSDTKGKVAILCDPLVSTADTMIAAIERLKNYQVKKIKVLSVLISVQAVKRIHALHPDVEIYTLSVEKKVNSSGYLVPGLGDAGDRLFKTK